MFSFIKKLFLGFYSFICRRPITFVVLLLFVAVGSVFATYEALHLTSKSEFCGLCHGEEGTGPITEYATWSKNVHAYGDVSCIDCHTIEPGVIGYAHSKVVVGLYDLVMQFAQSKESKRTKLARFDGDPALSEKTVSTELCLFCHGDESNIIESENKLMNIAYVPMRNLDSVRNPEYREMYGLIDIMKATSTSSVAISHAKHLDLDGMTCSTCHEMVAHSGEFKTTLDMQTCFDCHDTYKGDFTWGKYDVKLAAKEIVDNDDCASCHVLQDALQKGIIAGIEGDEWMMVDNECMDCHFDAFVKPEPSSCIDCHSEGYDDMMLDYQAEFDKQFAEAFKYYADNAKKREKMGTAKLTMFKRYVELLNILEKDGSRGIHTTDIDYLIFEEMAELREQMNTSS